MGANSNCMGWPLLAYLLLSLMGCQASNFRAAELGKASWGASGTSSGAQKAQVRSDPQVFDLSEVSLESLPALVPFAEIAVSNELPWRERGIFELYRQGSLLGADVVLIVNAGPERVFVEELELSCEDLQTTYQTERLVTYTRALACCVPLGDIGIQTDRDGQVLKIKNPSVRATGLVEGDTLFKVSGLTFDPTGGSAELNAWRKSAIPGEPMDLVWIRPGTGRLEGQALLMENGQSHLHKPDLVQEARGEAEPRRITRRARSLKGF